jgi:hypothetical protein
VRLLAVRAAVLERRSLRRGICHTSITYHHEKTILATIFAEFLAIGDVHIPACADELRSRHFEASIPKFESSRDSDDCRSPSVFSLPKQRSLNDHRSCRANMHYPIPTKRKTSDDLLMKMATPSLGTELREIGQQ